MPVAAAATAVLALLAVLGTELDAPRTAATWTERPRTGPPGIAAPGPAGGRAPGTERARQLAAVLDRPLFARDRRTVAAPGGGAGTFRLVGTVVETGGTRRALLSPPGGGRALVVREGAAAGPLVIRRIEAGRVLAERDAVAVLLVLGHGGVGEAVAAPAPSVPAPEMTKDPRSRAGNNQDE